MEIKVIITAEPALMALLENLGKAILVAGTDIREAAESATPTAIITPIAPTAAEPKGIDFQAHVVQAAPTAPVAPVAPVIPVAPAPVVPTAPAHTYSLSELGVAGADLAQSGKRSELIELLRTFGVQALTQLAPEKYPEFAQGLRALGAKI